jgi:hypothetical protein
MFVGRGSLPQNFLDSTSLGMRLPTPEPMYWFARMALAGRMSLAALNAGLPTIQQFVSMAGGGAPVPAELDSFIRAADAYPGAVIAVDDFGKGIGDTIKMRRDVFANSTYTKVSRRVADDKATSTTGLAVQMDEVPLVLEEYEGPFGASTVQPYIIREFDAKYRANKDQLVAVTTRNLVRDYIKTLDTIVRDEFRSTANITYADDVTNVLSFTGTGTTSAGHGASLDMILKAKKALSDREWSRFPNGKYICLVPTSFNVQMVGDPDYRALSAQQGSGLNQLFSYIASIQDIDIFECTTLKSYVAADGAVPGDTNTVPANATVFEGLIFGPGAVGIGTAQEPEARFADDTNYGKLARVIWNSKQAFGCLDTRGIQRFLYQA